MKKIISTIVAICAMAAVTTVSAQDFSYGVKVGLNMASLSGDDSDLDSRIGMVVGATAEYGFTDNMAISVDLLYSQQGATEGDYKFKTSYLNIPVLFNYYVIDGLAVKGGIQPGFLLSAKDSDDDDYKDGMNSLDLAIPIGVSYDITGGLFVDARYNIGLSNVWDDDYWSSSNNVFQITVGYKF